MPKFLKVELYSGNIFINVKDIHKIKEKGNGQYELVYSCSGGTVVQSVPVSAAELSNSLWTLEQIASL